MSLTDRRLSLYLEENMATTAIIPLHINKGKTAGKCIKERLDYIMNPGKTQGGTLVSSHACAPETAANEFMLLRNAYLANTGRSIPGEIIGYHVRQSFKPGEITPELANKIGYELAARLTNGEHAYVVATHTDRRNIHNHIFICSYALDGNYKYKNVIRSNEEVFRISDELCREYGLSVVQNPQNKTVSYDKWQGNQKPIASRDFLRMAIDAALRLQPDGFDALMQLLEEIGCRIKRGAHISILPPDGKRYIRLDSLGTEYTEASLRRALDGEHIHAPRVPRADYTDSQVKRLIDIESKLREGKGRGFVVWAERNNIDAKAQSVIYLKENHIHSYAELKERIQTLRSARNAINASIREKQNRMKEINRQRQAIRDYRRTKDVYTKYRESGWSPKFYNAHRQEIEDHKSAQAVYAAMDGKMPSMKELAAEYDALRETLETEKSELEELKPQLTTLNHIKYNFDIITRDHLPEPTNLDREQSTER